MLHFTDICTVEYLFFNRFFYNYVLLRFLRKILRFIPSLYLCISDENSDHIAHAWVKYVFSEKKKIRFVTTLCQVKCLKQIKYQRFILTWAPIFELPFIMYNIYGVLFYETLGMVCLYRTVWPNKSCIFCIDNAVLLPPYKNKRLECARGSFSNCQRLLHVEEV